LIGLRDLTGICRYCGAEAQEKRKYGGMVTSNKKIPENAVWKF
jgi:hypothetical protein